MNKEEFFVSNVGKINSERHLKEKTEILIRKCILNNIEISLMNMIFSF